MLKDRQGAESNQAIQVAMAEGQFYLSIYQGGLPGGGWDGETVAHEWISNEDIKQRLEVWEKVDRSSGAVGKIPPENAIVLFDGSSLDALRNGKLQDNFLKAGTRTKRAFKDFSFVL